MTTTTETERRRPATGLAGRAAIAVVASVAVNVGIVLAADAAGVGDDFRALTIPPVATLSAAGVVGAAVVYRLLARRVEDPDRTFRRVAVAALAVSFLPDLGLLVGDPAATPVGVALLMVMHVVVAGACLAAFTAR
jgi:hypothetical protein